MTQRPRTPTTTTMRERVHDSPNLIYPAGAQVVTLREVLGSSGRIAHPGGAVGVVVKSPVDRDHSYRVRFTDGFETQLNHDGLVLLAEYQQGDINDAERASSSLFDRVIFRCVIGSRAYGLENDQSDVDRRGVYLPPAELHWSLYGVPAQLENEATQEAYWELQKFVVLALKSNPNVLECLYSPLVETATPLAREMLDMKSIFLSKVAYQTYNGYVMSQFKKMQSDLRNQGKIKWKHVMHLIRLLLSGVAVLRDGVVPVRVDEHRERLLSVRAGEHSWDEIDRWRKQLHEQLDEAYAATKLPVRPDYAAANDFLIRARRLAVETELP